MIKGIYTALPTPFDSNNKINIEVLTQLIDYQASNNIDGILPAGTTGENPTFSEIEFQNIFELSQEMSKKHSIKFIAGCGSNDTLKALKLCKLAHKYNADAALVITPYYNKPNQTGLFEHFMYIANKSPIPIIMYNVPSRTGVNLEPQTVLKLQKHKNIIGLKEASGSLSQMQEILFNSHPEFSILSGEDELTYGFMTCGCHGVISVTGNLIPRDMSEMVHATLAGNFNKGLKLAKQINLLCKNMFLDTNPIPLKIALKCLGFDMGTVRLPLSVRNEKIYTQIEEITTSYIKKYNVTK